MHYKNEKALEKPYLSAFLQNQSFIIGTPPTSSMSKFSCALRAHQFSRSEARAQGLAAHFGSKKF